MPGFRGVINAPIFTDYYCVHDLGDGVRRVIMFLRRKGEHEWPEQVLERAKRRYPDVEIREADVGWRLDGQGGFGVPPQVPDEVCVYLQVNEDPYSDVEVLTGSFVEMVLEWSTGKCAWKRTILDDYQKFAAARSEYIASEKEARGALVGGHDVDGGGSAGVFRDGVRSPNADRSDSLNPNNAAYGASANNRSNQMNPNNPAYGSSRGGRRR